MDRAQKREEIKNLSESFSGSSITLCADYRGLTVAQITSLRRELWQSGARGVVAKNTLAKLSAEQAYSNADAGQLKKFLEIIEGPSLFVFSKADAIAPAKVLAKFAKSNDKLRIKGGFFEKSFIDPAGVDMLSQMPSREEVLAQLLRIINAPATQVVQLLQAPAAQVVRVLDAYREKLAQAA